MDDLIIVVYCCVPVNMKSLFQFAGPMILFQLDILIFIWSIFHASGDSVF